jgi:hypothetical protein
MAQLVGFDLGRAAEHVARLERDVDLEPLGDDPGRRLALVIPGGRWAKDSRRVVADAISPKGVSQPEIRSLGFVRRERRPQGPVRVHIGSGSRADHHRRLGVVRLCRLRGRCAVALGPEHSHFSDVTPRARTASAAHTRRTRRSSSRAARSPPPAPDGHAREGTLPPTLRGNAMPQLDEARARCRPSEDPKISVELGMRGHTGE